MGNEYSLRAPRRWLWLIAVGLALALAALAVPAIRHLREQPPPAAPTLRASWSAPEGLVVGASSEYPFGLALAPDGRRLVFPAGRDGRAQLWLQDLSVGSLAALPGTGGAVLPFWSPDGTRVGFFADASLKVISLDDARVDVLHAVAIPRGATWSARGDIVFTDDDGGLSVLSAAGHRGLSPDNIVGGLSPDKSPDKSVGGQSPAAARRLTSVDTAAGETAHIFPAFVAGGAYLVTFVRAGSAALQGLHLVSVADGTRTMLIGSASSGVAASEYLIYANDGALCDPLA